MKNSAFLNTGAESNLRDRVLSEVEKDSFLTLPGKGSHSGLTPSKLCVRPGGASESFIELAQRWANGPVELNRVQKQTRIYRVI